MIAVEVAAIYWAGLVCGPIWLVIALVLFAMLAPPALLLVFLACKLWIAIRYR